MPSEFDKYIGDYLKDHPKEQLHYWSEYPPYKDQEPTYWIGTNIIEKTTCKHCLTELTETLIAGERGSIFEVEVEEK